MFVIEATNSRNWRWISGVFQHRANAQAYFDSIPESARPLQRIVEVRLAAYPLFIIEQQGFEYGDLHFVKDKLRALVPAGNDDHAHFNVYVIREDFVPAKPGTDIMGILMHWHITDEYLAPPRATSFANQLTKIVSE